MSTRARWRAIERPVHVTPKAFDVLVLLAMARPRAVPKAEILDRVWPDTFVTDASLARTVHEIREVIGDSDGTVIRTGARPRLCLRRRGGRRVPGAAASRHQRPRSRARPGPALHLGVQPVPLHDGVLVIGRDPAASISVPFPQTSWQHARLTVTRCKGDASKTSGRRTALTCAVNGSPRQPTSVDGDDVLMGTTRLVFVRAPGERGTTATAPGPPGRGPG